MNSKKVIEEYVEDKSSQHISQSKESSIQGKGSGVTLGNTKDIPKLPIHKLNNGSNGSKGVSMDGIAHGDQTLASFHGS